MEHSQPKIFIKRVPRQVTSPPENTSSPPPKDKYHNNVNQTSLTTTSSTSPCWYVFLMETTTGDETYYSDGRKAKLVWFLLKEARPELFWEVTALERTTIDSLAATLQSKELLKDWRSVTVEEQLVIFLDIVVNNNAMWQWWVVWWVHGHVEEGGVENDRGWWMCRYPEFWWWKIGQRLFCLTRVFCQFSQVNMCTICGIWYLGFCETRVSPKLGNYQSRINNASSTINLG